ncbi:MAG: flagellar biosynthetic protein FliR [Oscillospiraceae bacterium]|nr:flagellar biosynthetic protein FliR [Oscillospiraceae bacterium]
MTSMANAVLASADYFVLLLFRVSALIFASPIFGRINIPQMAKIGIALSVTFLLFSVHPQTVDLEYSTLIGFTLIALTELMLGVALAFITNIFFSVVAFTAGQMIDMQIGFGIVNVFDAQNNMQAPMMGNILNLMFLLAFLAANGHLLLIDMIYLTVERMPIGTLVISEYLGIAALEAFTRAFLIGVMTALPILGAGLMLEICFGMMMRAVPQIHMFVVGIPLKMIVGVTIFTVTVPVFVNFTNRIFYEMWVALEGMFAQFMGGT